MLQEVLQLLFIIVIRGSEQTVGKIRQEKDE
jgi:hypothetical protein